MLESWSIRTNPLYDDPLTTPEKAPLKKIEAGILDRLAALILGLWSQAKRAWFRWAELNQHSSWFPFFVGAMVALDAIIVVLPADVIVILAVLSNPKAWKRTWLASGLGSVLGAFILFLLVRQTGGSFLNDLSEMNKALGAEDGWQHARVFFKEYGLSSLAIGSVLPLFSWPPVILAGLAHSEVLPVLGYLLVGRMVRYLLICWGTREGWAVFQTVRDKAREEKAETLAAAADLGGQKDGPAGTD